MWDWQGVVGRLLLVLGLGSDLMVATSTCIEGSLWCAGLLDWGWAGTGCRLVGVQFQGCYWGFLRWVGLLDSAGVPETGSDFMGLGSHNTELGGPHHIHEPDVYGGLVVDDGLPWRRVLVGGICQSLSLVIGPVALWLDQCVIAEPLHGRIPADIPGRLENGLLWWTCFVLQWRITWFVAHHAIFFTVSPLFSSLSGHVLKGELD